MVLGLLAVIISSCTQLPNMSPRRRAACAETLPDLGEPPYPDLASTLVREVTRDAVRWRTIHLEGSDEPLDRDTGMALALSMLPWFEVLDELEDASARCSSTDSPASHSTEELRAALEASVRALELRVEDPAPLDLLRTKVMTTDPWPVPCDDVAQDPRLAAVMWHRFGMHSRPWPAQRWPPLYIDGRLVCQRFGTRGLQLHIFAGAPTRGRDIATMGANVFEQELLCHTDALLAADTASGTYTSQPSYCAALRRLQLPYDAWTIVSSGFYSSRSCGDSTDHLLVRVGGRWRYVGSEALIFD